MKLVELYHEGKITAHTLVVESLLVLDPENPAAVLEDLPEEVLVETEAYCKRYITTQATKFPRPKQIASAINWISKNGK